MTASRDSLRRGWCPGALRPMRSGDGLLVRIKPSCSRLSIDQAIALTELAQRHGNGLIELTSRANVQLRGVTDEALAPLTSALSDLELLDATTTAEAARNVMSTPLAGIDPSACDTRAIAEALEERLRAADGLDALPDKFGYLIDGGGLLPLSDEDGDIQFVWGGHAFCVALAREDGHQWIGNCDAEDVADVALRIARSFLSYGGDARRMRHLPDKACATLARAAQLGTYDRPSSTAAWSAGDTRITGCMPRGKAGGAPVAVAIGLPYGGTTAPALAGLLATARQLGISEVRVTPWRAVLLPIDGDTAASDLLAEAGRLGFITQASDPRRALAACPGAPACGNASTPVRADADDFSAAAAALLLSGFDLHVSGCSKGCAKRRAAALTLVAEEGRYGLVVNGTAADATCGRFSAGAAAETLARLASAMTKAGGAPYSGGTAIEKVLKEILAA